jgi:hypothetical protein
MSDPKPMDPERLALLRNRLRVGPMTTLVDELVPELLDHADYQERRAEQAEAARDYLARVSGSAICRATCIAPGETVVEHDPDIAGDALTGAVERLRARAEQAERERDEARAENFCLEYENACCHIDLLQAEIARLRARVRVEAEDVERPELPPGVTVKYDQATGEWSTEHGFGASRKEAIDSTWNRWPGDPWVTYADSQAARAEQLQRERDEAIHRLRTRTRPKADDVERAIAAGLTWEKCLAWALVNGVHQSFIDGVLSAGDFSEADRICSVARGASMLYVKRSPWDILDEMAAMPVEAERAANHALDK